MCRKVSTAAEGLASKLNIDMFQVQKSIYFLSFLLWEP